MALNSTPLAKRTRSERHKNVPHTPKEENWDLKVALALLEKVVSSGMEPESARSWLVEAKEAAGNVEILRDLLKELGLPSEGTVKGVRRVVKGVVEVLKDVARRGGEGGEEGEEGSGFNLSVDTQGEEEGEEGEEEGRGREKEKEKEKEREKEREKEKAKEKEKEKEKE